jgi:hypothetical protein
MSAILDLNFRKEEGCRRKDEHNKLRPGAASLAHSAIPRPGRSKATRAESKQRFIRPPSSFAGNPGTTAVLERPLRTQESAEA